LQLAGVGFAGATDLVGYLHDLGVETLYVSPVLAAVPGSTHGYDVVDPTCFDPALGDAAQFEALLAALAARGMRLLVDIVPNHMATDPANSWWWDVLRRGRESEYSPIFDIDWPAQNGRVLVPTLAEPLGNLLSQGAASVVNDVGVGEPLLDLAGQRFPLRPQSVQQQEAEAARSPKELADVVAGQHYRPAYWRVSGDEGNYRRFFDIDGLIGVRVEDPDVFDVTHRYPLKLGEDDRIAGWRVDHIDGLADPAAYLVRLRRELARHRAPDAVVLIEKILARDEVVPPGWEVDGTTGYEFASLAGGLFVRSDGAASLGRSAVRLTGEDRTFSELGLTAKCEMLDRSFGSPVRRLVGLVTAALAEDVPGHDLSDAVIGEALRHFTVHLDAYRTYLDGGAVDPHDRARLKKAHAAAIPHLSVEGRRALGYISSGLLGDRVASAPAQPDARSTDAWLSVARRWQQLSGAVMAKGVEDTATYRFSGLLGHAEVGSDPEHPAVSPAEFFAATRLRGRRHPSSLNATSTHDSKRSEDARARLFTLSEVPSEWNRLTARWHRRHAPIIAAVGGPDVHDELVTYQTMAAMWPHGHSHLSPHERRRIEEYMVKAAREAKRHTTWTDPNGQYERSLRSFIRRLTRPGSTFGSEMERLVRRIGPAAASNSLAFTVLKAICPGVPDVYQGTELWDFSLTDPDNRRPVDFAARRALMAGLPAPDALSSGAEAAPAVAALLRSWPDGRIKMHVLRALLHLRRCERPLFERGSYQLLEASGAMGEHVMGMVRRNGRRWVVALVPRLTLARAGAGRFPTAAGVWGTTEVHLPARAPRRLTDVLTGLTIESHGGALNVGHVLETLPVAVLSGVTSGPAR
jgi:(1->4)-alpha-D-glucan 1-alpha-D-glucosylmutase